MPILYTQDFINKYELSTGMYDTLKLESYIKKYEERYLLHLFGVKLYNQFTTDLDNGLPRSPNFVKVFEPFNEDLSNTPFLYNQLFGSVVMNTILESEGIKEMLKGFIYFEYSKDLMNQQTPYGNVKQRAENSVVVDSPHSMMYSRYNEAMTTYRAIQQYIYLNRSSVLGQIVSYTLTDGTGYVDGDANLLGGTGTGGVVTLTTAPGNGHIVSLVLKSSGVNYVAGDVLNIEGGNADASLTLTYVGTGDFQLFRGVQKSMAYWI